MNTANTTDFEAFFLHLSTEQREAFAADAGTSAVYLRDHLLSGRRMPRPNLLNRLADALNARHVPIGRDTLSAFFHARWSAAQVGAA